MRFNLLCEEKTISREFVPCIDYTLTEKSGSGKFWFGERFPRRRSQQQGSLRWRWVRQGVAPSRWGGPGLLPPENFLMPNPAFGGNLGQKINWSTVNLTSMTWSPERISVSIPPVVNDIYRSAVPAPKYIRRNGVPAPLHTCCQEPGSDTEPYAR